MRKSTDGGDIFCDEKTVAEFYYRNLNVGKARSNNFPSLAIDQLTGNLYVAYMDFPSPNNLDNHIKFISSTNGGSTWSESIIIGDLGVPTDKQYFPWVSVDENGRIAVLFVNYSSPYAATYYY